MSARTTQWLIAAIFLILGGWALFAPASVIEFAIAEEYHSDAPVVRWVMACFGAQAMLFGIVALVTNWTKRSFLVFGLLLLPFLLFDWYFHFVEPILTTVGMLDLAGNLAMLALCWHGWRVAEA